MFLGEKCGFFFYNLWNLYSKKNPTFYWKVALRISKYDTEFQGNISTNNIAIAG